jgi:hypothetical protein
MEGGRVDILSMDRRAANLGPAWPAIDGGGKGHSCATGFHIVSCSAARRLSGQVDGLQDGKQRPAPPTWRFRSPGRLPLPSMCLEHEAHNLVAHLQRQSRVRPDLTRIIARPMDRPVLAERRPTRTFPLERAGARRRRGAIVFQPAASAHPWPQAVRRSAVVCDQALPS